MIKFIKGLACVENIRTKIANVDIWNFGALSGMNRKMFKARGGQIALDTAVLGPRMRSRVVIHQ